MVVMLNRLEPLNLAELRGSHALRSPSGDQVLLRIEYVLLSETEDEHAQVLSLVLRISDIYELQTKLDWADNLLAETG